MRVGLLSKPRAPCPPLAGLCPQPCDMPRCRAGGFLQQMGPLPACARTLPCGPRGAGQDLCTRGSLLLKLILFPSCPGGPQAAPPGCLHISRHSSSTRKLFLYHSDASSPFQSFLTAWRSFSQCPPCLTHPSIKYLLNPCRVPITVLRLWDTRGARQRLRSHGLDPLLGEADHNKPTHTVHQVVMPARKRKRASWLHCEASPRFLLQGMVCV